MSFSDNWLKLPHLNKTLKIENYLFINYFLKEIKFIS